MFIDPSLLVPTETKEAMEDCKCSICAGVLVEPMECSKCLNSFCKHCLDKWSKESKTCPLRCKNPNYHPSKKLNSLLSSLKFFCQNGCQEIIPYSSLNEHYTFKCPLLNYKSKIEEYSAKTGEIVVKFNKLKQLIEYYKDFNSSLKNGNAPTTVILSLKHQHELRLSKRSGSWICDVCRTHYSFLIQSFYCKECDFDLCCECYLNEFYNLH